MIYAKKLPSGELVNISLREQATWDDGSVDVPLDAMPDGFGPFTYDAVNRVAVPLTVNQHKERDINVFAVSDDPQARSVRALGRIVLDAVGNIIKKHNANLDLMVAKQIYTQAEANALKLPVRDFATLMASVKAAAINEADPTK